MSSYAYAHHNPLNVVDPNGRWASKFGLLVHQWAIANTLGHRVGRDAVRIMQQMQVAIDERQSNRDQHLHAMRGPSTTRAEAISRANDFVARRIGSAIAQYKRGNKDIAWAQLGEAIHTLQDATSPEHEGFQVFDADSSTASHAPHALGEFQYPGAEYSSVLGGRPGSSDPRKAQLEGVTVWAYDIFLQGVTDGRQRIGRSMQEMPTRFFDRQGNLLLPREYLSEGARRGEGGQLE